MAMNSRVHKLKNIDNTGFSTNNNRTEGGRLANKDGSINIRKIGMPPWVRVSLYHTLLRMPRMRFLLVVFLFYTVLNVIFAGLYMLVGVEHLQGVLVNNDMLNNFQQAYFFSSQTLTTVGYGHISPVGLEANIIASLESFIGILSFALVTGLLYGRFTRPRAYIRFSDNVLIAPYNNGRALMARLATYKNNHLTDVEAQVTVVIHIRENGEKVRRFYNLPLEIKRINSMALSWTLVHPIDEESPFYNMGEQAIMEAEIELLYHIKGFDDHFSNTVQQRTSYVSSEVVYGAKFLPMFHRTEDGQSTIVELDKINAYEPAVLPEIERTVINA